MKYKHIIWDWNGTLVDDTWLCVEIINKLLKKRNLKLVTIDDYKEKFMFPVREYYIELGSVSYTHLTLPTKRIV